MVDSVDDCPESMLDVVAEIKGAVRGELVVHERDTPVESAAAMFVMMFRLAVRVPDADGVHVTCTVQLVPPMIPATAVEQLSEETLKSPAFAPVMLAGWTTIGPVPVFDTVTVWAPVVMPTPLLVKSSDVGVTDLL